MWVTTPSFEAVINNALVVLRSLNSYPVTHLLSQGVTEMDPFV